MVFDRIETSSGGALFPIDDVNFNLNPAAEDPEPATWAFMILGCGTIDGNRQVSTTVRYA